MLNFKKITEEDLEIIRINRNDERINKWMHTTCNISQEDQVRWYRSLNKNDFYFIVMNDDVPIGYASVNNIDIVNKKCTWGFYLFPNFFGNGFAPIILYKLIDFVFSLDINRLECTVFPNNPVVKLYEKFGFKQEAFYRDYIIKDGNTFDIMGMALLKREWMFLRNILNVDNTNEFNNYSDRIAI